LLNAAGALVWATAIASGGYSFGHALEVLIGKLKSYEMYIMGGIAMVGLLIWIFHSIGLRFTVLINLHGQRIIILNRNIATISQFRGGCIRAYVDIQLPQEVNEKETSPAIQSVCKGMYNQHRSIILAPPEIFGIKDVEYGQWRYLRIKFKLWPGQIKIIEETFKERVVQLLKKSDADYASWMITVTYKVE